MKRNTKIFSGLAIGAIIAISATVVSSQMHEGRMKLGHLIEKNHDMKQNHSIKGNHENRVNHGIMSLVRQLNLSDKQQTSIRAIVDENISNRQAKYMVFIENSLERSEYIKQMESAQENKIKQQTQTIENIYALLDTKQKNQLKGLLDLKEEKVN